MISYELAKELKDAGFPQNGLGLLCIHGIYGIWDIVDKKIKGYKGICNICTIKKIVYIPTLSELIEACGETFRGIQIENKIWQAWAVKWTKEHHIVYAKDCEYPYNTRGNGQSPEEAVTRLWLELNKHEKETKM